MSEKTKILIFIDWFLPGYKAGGPIRSVANIINTLSHIFDFYIVTSDRDLGDEFPYKNIETNKAIRRTNYTITYLARGNQNIKSYKKILKSLNPDKVYLNSLFSFRFSVLPLIASKKHIFPSSVILAPRGMLGKGAINLKKTKKSGFLKLSSLFKLYSGITWHATTQDEAKDIKNTISKKAKVINVGNIPTKPKNYFKKKKTTETKFVFISRISKKKNLLFAIELLKGLNTETKVVFDIFGPEEDFDYKKQCDNIIFALPKNISVKFKGELSHDEVENTLRNYHFFLFPTLHENYGHAVFEALSASCPVVLSKNTPWKNLEEKKIGWDINLNDKEKFQTRIQKCIEMKQEEYDTMSENAFNFAKDFFESSQAVKDTQKMFEDE
ncbi:MAG: glycosyltransferase [Bacteroidales bacterium]|nr:glycosyltransferase [Bacteroidales bacterium]